MTITKNEMNAFHEQGYAVLDSIIAPELLRSLQGMYDHMFAEKRGRKDGNQFDLAGQDADGEEARIPQILNPSRYETSFRPLADTCLQIGRALLGEEAVLMEDHAILKPVGCTQETPWHQDEAYWDAMKHYTAMSIWVPLQDVPQEAGCLHFVPKSHRLSVLPHQPIGDDSRVHGLELAPNVYDCSHAQACPLTVGSATVHWCRTLHYAGENTVNEARRAYIANIGLPPQVRTEQRVFAWLEKQRTARQARIEKGTV